MMELYFFRKQVPDKEDKHANKGKAEWNERHFDLVSAGREECSV